MSTRVYTIAGHTTSEEEKDECGWRDGAIPWFLLFEHIFISLSNKHIDDFLFI